MQSIKLTFIIWLFVSSQTYSADETPRYPLSEERRRELIEEWGRVPPLLCKSTKKYSEELLYPGGPWDTQECTYSKCPIKTAVCMQRADINPCCCCCVICAVTGGSASVAGCCMPTTGTSCAGLAPGVLMLLCSLFSGMSIGSTKWLEWTTDPVNWADEERAEYNLVPIDD